MEQEILENKAPTGKIFKDRAISVGTFLGGPLVAGYMIAENYKVFGEPGKASKTWIYTILFTVLLFVVIFLMPETTKISDRLIPLVYTIAAYLLVQQLQGTQIDNHIDSGGKVQGWGRILGIGAIGLVLIVAWIVVFSIAIDLLKG